MVLMGKSSGPRKGTGKTAVAPVHYPPFTRFSHDRATTEEFDRENMGVAAKE